MMQNTDDAETNSIVSDEIPLYLPDELLDENSFTYNEEVFLNQRLSFTKYSDQVQEIKTQLDGIREDIDEIAELQPELSLQGKLNTNIPKSDGNKSDEWECSICLKNLAEVKSFLIHSKYIIHI